MQEVQVIRSLSALAHEARLRVFRALVVGGPEGLTPSALAEQLGIASNALSFHLKELSHAELVSQERQAGNVRCDGHLLARRPPSLSIHAAADLVANVAEPRFSVSVRAR